MSEDWTTFTAEEINAWLKANRVPEHTAQLLLDERVSGGSLVNVRSIDDIKEIVPALKRGEAQEILNLLFKGGAAPSTSGSVVPPSPTSIPKFRIVTRSPWRYLLQPECTDVCPLLALANALSLRGDLELPHSTEISADALIESLVALGGNKVQLQKLLHGVNVYSNTLNDNPIKTSTWVEDGMDSFHSLRVRLFHVRNIADFAVADLPVSTLEKYLSKREAAAVFRTGHFSTVYNTKRGRCYYLVTAFNAQQATWERDNKYYQANFNEYVTSRDPSPPHTREEVNELCQLLECMRIRQSSPSKVFKFFFGETKTYANLRSDWIPSTLAINGDLSGKLDQFVEQNKTRRQIKTERKVQTLVLKFMEIFSAALGVQVRLADNLRGQIEEFRADLVFSTTGQITYETMVSVVECKNKNFYDAQSGEVGFEGRKAFVQTLRYVEKVFEKQPLLKEFKGAITNWKHWIIFKAIRKPVEDSLLHLTLKPSTERRVGETLGFQLIFGETLYDIFQDAQRNQLYAVLAKILEDGKKSFQAEAELPADFNWEDFEDTSVKSEFLGIGKFRVFPAKRLAAQGLSEVWVVRPHTAFESTLGTPSSSSSQSLQCKPFVLKVAFRSPHEKNQLSQAETEARFLQHLQDGRHPHLPTLVAFEKRGIYTLTLTRPLGITLEMWTNRYGPRPADEVRRIGTALAKTLDYIHSADVMHRDICPANIILAEEAPYIIDFGHAVMCKDRMVESIDVDIIGHRNFVPAESYLMFRQVMWHDWLALLYTLLYVTCGGLPWSDKPKEKIVQTQLDFVRRYPASAEEYLKQYGLHEDAERRFIVMQLAKLLAGMSTLAPAEWPSQAHSQFCQELCSALS